MKRFALFILFVVSFGEGVMGETVSEETFLGEIAKLDGQKLEVSSRVPQLVGLSLPGLFWGDWSNRRGMGTGSLAVVASKNLWVGFTRCNDNFLLLLVKTIGPSAGLSVKVVDAIAFPLNKPYWRIEHAWREGDPYDPYGSLFGIETSAKPKGFLDASMVRSEFTIQIDVDSEKIVVLNGKKATYYISGFEDDR